MHWVALTMNLVNIIIHFIALLKNDRSLDRLYIWNNHCTYSPMKFRLVSSVFALFLSFLMIGQQDTLAKYGPGFRFKDGIYFSAIEFKDNCPAISRADVFDKNKNPRADLDPKEPYYTMNQDSLIKLDFDTIWGICENGQVFIQHNTAFDRLIVVGKLCHIIHREEVIDYNSNIGMGVGSVPVRREVQVEYLIDMDSGDKVPFTSDNLLHFIQDDHILYYAYSQMSKKERRKAQYVYLHKYNNENPIYFLISGCHKEKEVLE